MVRKRVLLILWGVTAWVLIGIGLFAMHVAELWIPPRVMFTLFSGELELYWYSFFIVCAILLGTAVVVQLAKDGGEDRQIMWRGLTWMLVFGFIGARLFYVTFPPPTDLPLGIERGVDYWRNLSLLFSVRLGGLRLFGALFGGGLGWLLYSYRFRLPLLVWFDRLALGCAAGLAVGYWGHFFNQGLYGRPTNMFWGWPITELYRLPELTTFERFQPIFLFASLFMLLVCWCLFWLRQYRSEQMRPGGGVAVFLLSVALKQLLFSRLFVNTPLLVAGLFAGWSVNDITAIGLVFVIGVWQGAVFAQLMR